MVQQNIILTQRQIDQHHNQNTEEYLSMDLAGIRIEGIYFDLFGTYDRATQNILELVYGWKTEIYICSR